MASGLHINHFYHWPAHKRGWIPNPMGNQALLMHSVWCVINTMWTHNCFKHCSQWTFLTSILCPLPSGVGIPLPFRSCWYCIDPPIAFSSVQKGWVWGRTYCLYILYNNNVVPEGHLCLFRRCLSGIWVLGLEPEINITRQDRAQIFSGAGAQAPKGHPYLKYFKGRAGVPFFKSGTSVLMDILSNY